MSLDNNEEEPTFIAACFSTNNLNFNPIEIMKQYFMSTECQDINNTQKSKVEFTHKLLGENGQKLEYKNIYYEITTLIKNNNKINDQVDQADCYIIFFDLENNSSLVELNKILKHISENWNINKKFYVINFYANYNNIKSNLTDDNINVYFLKYSILNYDISIVNMDSLDELVKVIDSLTEDTLEDKNMLKDNKDMNPDKSKSKCLIV